MRTTSRSIPARRSIGSRLLLVALASMLALALAACGGDDDDDDDGGTGAPAADAAVTVEDFSFTASPVEAGATVTVDNQGATTHTVTADDGGFDVSVDGGDSATFTAPSEAGDYAFHCNIHSNMTSSLTVE